jgi:hypothetical protein
MVDLLKYHRLIVLTNAAKVLKGRWIRWILVSAAIAMMLVLLILEVAKRSDFRKAAQWHKAHGDVLHFDGHELSLPRDWWERDYPTDGKRVLVKASRSLLKIWQTGIVIDQRGPNEINANEADIRKTLERMIRADNQGRQAPISSLVVLSSASTRIYCKKAMIVEPMIELRCDVIGTPTLITSVGTPDSVEDIEGILSTFR